MLNASWHDKHRLGRQASAKERLAWHLAHAKACGCRPLTSAFRAKLVERARAEAEPALDPAFSSIVKAMSKQRGVTFGGKGFGSSALKADGKIFAMLSSQGEFVVKLSKARVDELVESGVGERFDPGRGRPMKEWLAVDAPKKRWLALAKEALAFTKQSS
jgi:hypothetical protein